MGQRQHYVDGCGTQLVMRTQLVAAWALLLAAAVTPADSKLANLHRGLKGGGEIYVGSEFSCAIRGLNHIARQKLISVVSKTKTKRCVATSATAAFNNCIEMRRTSLGENSAKYVETKNVRQVWEESHPDQAEKVLEGGAHKSGGVHKSGGAHNQQDRQACPVEVSEDAIQAECITMCKSLLTNSTAQQRELGIGTDRLCKQPYLWKRVLPKWQTVDSKIIQRCTPDAMHTTEQRCDLVCGQQMGAVHDSCGLMSIGSPTRETDPSGPIAWVKQPFEDIMFMNSQGAKVGAPAVGREMPMPMRSPSPITQLKVDMCKPATTGQIVCVNQHLTTQQMKVRSAHPNHLKTLQSYKAAHGDTFTYNVTQLMVKVTACRANDLDSQCIHTTTGGHRQVGHKWDTGSIEMTAAYKQLQALRGTVVPKLQCETKTLSRVIRISPCTNGWDEKTMTHRDPILDMMDSEMVFTEGMTHW